MKQTPKLTKTMMAIALIASTTTCAYAAAPVTPKPNDNLIGNGGWYKDGNGITPWANGSSILVFSEACHVSIDMPASVNVGPESRKKGTVVLEGKVGTNCGSPKMELAMFGKHTVDGSPDRVVAVNDKGEGVLLELQADGWGWRNEGVTKDSVYFSGPLGDKSSVNTPFKIKLGDDEPDTVGEYTLQLEARLTKID